MNFVYLLKQILSDKNYYISSLNLSKNVIGDEGIKIVAKIIAKSNTLVHIDVSSNEIKRDGVNVLFKELMKNQSLNCLILGITVTVNSLHPQITVLV